MPPDEPVWLTEIFPTIVWTRVLAEAIAHTEIAAARAGRLLTVTSAGVKVSTPGRPLAAGAESALQELAVARTGLASATARRDLRVRGAFHALAAMNLSRRGEAGQAQRSLGRAFDALGSGTTAGQAGRWSLSTWRWAN